MLSKNLIPKVKKTIYNERSYAKLKEAKIHCEDCGMLVFKNKYKAHIETNKHKTNLEKVKVDFNTEVQKLAKELVKSITKTNLIALYEIIKHEYFNDSGEELEEEIEYNKPSPLTEAERIFCNQEVGPMNMEVMSRMSDFDNEGYNPIYLERLEKRHSIIDAGSAEAKIKLLDFYRKCETFIEDTEKEIEKDKLKAIEERDKELREMEKKNNEAKKARLQERAPDRKIIKEIIKDIDIPELIEEDFEYNVNSDDEDCNSEDSYDVEAQFYKEAEELYKNFSGKKRIDILQKELEGCEDFIDYQKFSKELNQKGSNLLLDLETIKTIYCDIKKYKYDLEKYN